MLLLFYRDAAASSDFQLATTEGQDTASAVMGASVALVASEQPDVVTASLVEGANLALSATEASDTVAASVDIGSAGFVLSATEGNDTIAVVMGAGVALLASEQPDSASFDLEAGSTPAVGLTLVATETADTVSLEVDGDRRRGGISRKRIPVVDVIWPNDPRHPQYVAPAQTRKPEKPQGPVVIKVARKPIPEPALAAVQKPAPNYDTEIALLLLAA